MVHHISCKRGVLRCSWRSTRSQLYTSIQGRIWSVLDGTWGVLKGTWGVLASHAVARCMGQPLKFTNSSRATAKSLAQRCSPRPLPCIGDASRRIYLPSSQLAQAIQSLPKVPETIAGMSPLAAQLYDPGEIVHAYDYQEHLSRQHLRMYPS